MYLTSAITLPGALGSVILIIGRNRLGMENFVLMCSATGLTRLSLGVFGRLVGLAFDVCLIYKIWFLYQFMGFTLVG